MPRESSIYRGVSPAPDHKWIAQFTHQRHYYAGRYQDDRVAALIYNVLKSMCLSYKSSSRYDPNFGLIYFDKEAQRLTISNIGVIPKYVLDFVESIISGTQISLSGWIAEHEASLASLIPSSFPKTHVHNEPNPQSEAKRQRTTYEEPVSSEPSDDDLADVIEFLEYAERIKIAPAPLLFAHSDPRLMIHALPHGFKICHVQYQNYDYPVGVFRNKADEDLRHFCKSFIAFLTKQPSCCSLSAQVSAYFQRVQTRTVTHDPEWLASFEALRILATNPSEEFKLQLADEILERHNLNKRSASAPTLG